MQRRSPSRSLNRPAADTPPAVRALRRRIRGGIAIGTERRGARAALAERLVELDTAIAREIDEWAARELPQIIARELERLGERIQDEALAHLRATLLPGSLHASAACSTTVPDVPPAR